MSVLVICANKSVIEPPVNLVTDQHTSLLTGVYDGASSELTNEKNVDER